MVMKPRWCRHADSQPNLYTQDVDENANDNDAVFSRITASPELYVQHALVFNGPHTASQHPRIDCLWLSDRQWEAGEEGD